MSGPQGWLRNIAAAVVAAATLIAAGQTACAASLTLSGADWRSAVTAAQIGTHSRIVIKPGVHGYGPVSLQVSDATTPAGRVAVVSTLADALDANYTKVFIVRRNGATTPPIDDDSTISFQSRRIPAMRAIRMLAGIDGAVVHFRQHIPGDIVLSSRQMPLAQAAAEVALQTGTSWQPVYILSPRPNTAGPMAQIGEPASANQPTVQVIGHTASGEPITEYPATGGVFAHRTVSPPDSTSAGQVAATQPAPANQNSPSPGSPVNNPNPAVSGYPYPYPYAYPYLYPYPYGYAYPYSTYGAVTIPYTGILELPNGTDVIGAGPNVTRLGL
ncbi:MAG: hypothetical protein ACLQVD_22990 [Capsulimonadaceae bacterium]